MIRSAPARKGQTALSGRAPDAGSWVRRRRRFLVEDGEMIEALPTIPMAGTRLERLDVVTLPAATAESFCAPTPVRLEASVG